MPNRQLEVSTAEVWDHATDPNHTVVDVRPVAAYNGWRLAGEPRGGHVPGATNLPADWIRNADWEEILTERGISSDRPITLYGYETDEVRWVMEQLAAVGYDTIAIYPRFLDEWVGDPERPIERLERYEQLVYPEWLQAVIQGNTPPAGPNGDAVICHVHFDDFDDYATGHVRGAIPLDTTALEARDDWNLRPPAELESALVEHGIRHDTTVILYGRPAATGGCDADNEPIDGQLGAMRCAVIMLYAGVEDVRMLNGGLNAWTLAGFDVTTAISRPQPVESFGTTVPARPELVIDTAAAKAWLADDDKELVSVRSHDEVSGDTSGYSYISARGHIPGAILAQSGSGAHQVEGYRNDDQTMRASHEVAASWQEKGVTPDKRVAFYCGTGWRSSEAFMHAYFMGWSDHTVYDGGWYEWSSDPDNPIDRGEPQDGDSLKEGPDS